MKLLYLDESGNHDLRPTKINPRYPVFVLGGVVVDRAYERTVIASQMRDFKIIACAIKLHDHIAQYGQNALDPYMYSLDVVVEQFCKELNNTTDSGFICAEMRNPGLDRNLRAAWDNIRREGTTFTSAAEIEEKIVHLTLKDKKPNIAGMQLADLIATPVGRGVLRLPTKDDEVSRRVVKRKFRRGGFGQHRGYGLVVLPGF